MNSRTVLAVDIGASSGRIVHALYDGEKITYREIHRFPNDPVNLNGTLYWDVPRLYHEIKQGILKAKRDGFDCISIDTWGLDMALLDSHGELVQLPVHYRDKRTLGVMEELFEEVSAKEIYDRTGIQFMRFNTLYQFYYLARKCPDLLERTDKFVMITDLFHFLLTGEVKTEYTNASTSQMLDPRTGQWDFELLDKLNIPKRIFPEIIQPGSVYGMLSDEVCEELGCDKVPVVATATHDTASAVVSVPARERDFVYISCGTWSLLGTELSEPIINDTTLQYNFTNEGGVEHTTRLLKNIMGLWLIQESRRHWLREGMDVTYADLEREALACAPYRCFVDPDYAEFDRPGNLPRRIQEFCRSTGQYVPESRGEIMRCIYESLAFKYRLVFQRLCKVTGLDYPAIHVVGGGTKDNLLCQLTADACKIDVTAGPIEATITGNIAVTLVGMGDIASLKEAREVVCNSVTPDVYQPRPTEGLEEAYARFCEIAGASVDNG